MPTIAELNQRHPCWDGEEFETLQALYEGGARFKKRLDKFLPKRPGEPLDRHALRKTESVYRNYLGPAIDFFAALLFEARPVAVPKRTDGAKDVIAEAGDYYAGLRDDCDNNGTDIDAFFRDRLTQAMIARRSWFRVDVREANVTPEMTKADYDDQKLGDAWLCKVDGDSVLDWEHDELGRLSLVITHEKTARRAGVSGGRSMITETWTVFESDRTETFRISYDKNNPPPDVTPVPSTGVVANRFGRIPLVCMELPFALWCASRLETPQLAHFRLSNAQTWGMTSTCYAMPVYKMKPDSKGRARSPTLGAGYALIINPEEDISWTAPPADVYAALGAEISSQKDEIFRIAHQMALGVDNNAAAVGRSADSKIADAEATRVVLGGYSKAVKEAIEITYDLISDVRGEKYEWSIEGLDDFAATDIDGLVTVLGKVDLAGGIPSPTFNAIMKTRLAESLLPDVDQETKATIKKEIEGGVHEAHEINAAMKAASADAIINGPDQTEDPNAGDAGSGGKAPRRGRQKGPPRGSRGAGAAA